MKIKINKPDKTKWSYIKKIWLLTDFLVIYESEKEPHLAKNIDPNTAIKFAKAYTKYGYQVSFF